MRKLRYGGIHIRYGRFPFFLGEPLDVRVATAKPLPGGVPVTARLRFVQEAISTRGGNMVVDYFEGYGDETTVTPDSTGELAIRFALPEGDLLTDLSRDNRRFWELNLQARVAGAPFEETFLLPVYRRP